MRPTNGGLCALPRRIRALRTAELPVPDALRSGGRGRFRSGLPKPPCEGDDMNRLSLLFSAVLALQAGAAFGDDITCRQTYGETLRTCARTLNLLSPDLRTGAQRACVEGARLTQAYCMAGADACLDDCLAAYDRSVPACETVFDSVVCVGGAQCERTVTQQRDNCLSYAVDVLGACSAACTPTR